MRTIFSACLIFLVAATAAAQLSTSVRFLPAAPDSRSPITARVGGVWHDGGHPRCGQATVSGKTILIATGCLPQVAPAAVTPWSLDVFIGVLEAGVYDVRVTIPFDPRTPTVPTPITIAERQLVVQEADPAFTVSPNIGYAGATEPITLQGAALHCDDTAGACPQPVVRFGTQVAPIRRIERDVYEVTAPAGTGTVDITVETLRTVRRVAAFHYVDVQQPPAPEFFTPLLVPVLFSAPGAMGSIWDTEISGRNDNAFRFTSPYGTPFQNWCFVCDPPPPPGLGAHTSGTIRASASLVTAPAGMLSYIPREGSENVHFGLLVRDLSRQREALGAEVPVVREHELFDGRSFSLLNIPVDARFRTALRIYTLEGAGTVRLRIRPMFGDTTLVDITRNTAKPGFTSYDHGVLVIGDLLAAFPAIGGRGPIRIEVFPVSPGGVRTWGFATVTNNDTQHVTVISPQ